MIITRYVSIALAALCTGGQVHNLTAAENEVILGPVGPSPYTIVEGWHKPFAPPGYAFGGNSGLFAETPDRILVAQRGEYRLPDPVPESYAGYAGSIGVNVLGSMGLSVRGV